MTMLFSACLYVLAAVLALYFLRHRAIAASRHLYTKREMLGYMPKTLQLPNDWKPLPASCTSTAHQSKDLQMRVKSLSKGHFLRLPSTDESDYDHSFDSSWSCNMRKSRDSPCCDKDIREENRRLVTTVLSAPDYSASIREAFEKTKDSSVALELRTYEVLLKAAIDGEDLLFTNLLLTEISSHGFSLKSSLVEAYLALFNRKKALERNELSANAEEFRPTPVMEEKPVWMNPFAEDFVPT